MPRNKSSSRGSKPLRVRGVGQLSASLSSTSAVGSFVVTRYEIDTTLIQSWNQLGQTFVRWRPIMLIFHFKSLKGTSTDGNAGICYLPDTNETTPTTTTTAYSNECAVYGHVHQNLSLKLRLKHNKWLYTRDAVASSEDRLEMPGDVCYWTDNCSSAFVPGIASLSYIVEFDQVANSTVAPLNKTVTSDGISSKEVDDEMSPEELIAAAKQIFAQRRKLKPNKE